MPESAKSPDLTGSDAPASASTSQGRQLHETPKISSHKLTWLYRECSRNVLTYEKLVRESKELWAALRFARFLIWSGVVELLEAYSMPGTVNGPLLRHRCKELETDACTRLKSGTPEPLAQLDAIIHRLDLIAGHQAKVELMLRETQQRETQSHGGIRSRGGFSQGGDREN